MEKNFDEVLLKLLNNPGVYGCVVTDKQGLCLGAKGVTTPHCSGLLTALVDYAKSLHTDLIGPTIVLENDEKQCIIKSNEKIVLSVYKSFNV